MEMLMFLVVFFGKVDTYRLVLSIYIAENALMIMMTILLCIEGFFAA